MEKYVIICIAITAAVTFFTRAVPFLIFGRMKEMPKTIKYLGETLPPCVMVILVVYCVRNIDILNSPYGLPELSCLGIAVILQWVFKNTYLSIIISTVGYMLLLRL